VLFTISVAAQSPARNSAAPAQSKSSQPPTHEIDEKLAALEKRVTELEGTVQWYKYEIDGKQDKTETVILDPSSREFQRLDSDSGTFLVSLADASPYLNGYRINLDLGNPSNAKYSNAKLKITWGPAIKDFSKYDEWKASLHEKDVDITSNLEPGAWNHETIDLIPCSSNDLGYLKVSLQTPTVILHTNSSQ
jgi:hypothetical protein